MNVPKYYLQIMIFSMLLLPIALPCKELSREEAFERMKRIELLYRTPFSLNQYSIVSSNPSALLSIGRPRGREERRNGVRKPNKDAKGNYLSFKNALALRESSGDPTAINEYGMIGLYQFSQEALEDCKYEVDPVMFQKRPSIFPEQKQHEVFDTWVKVLYGYLGDYIDRYDGRTINAIDLDTSSILAGAHLIGAQGMKNWLSSNGRTDVRDGYGTPLTEYLKLFHGYSISDTISSI